MKQKIRSFYEKRERILRQAFIMLYDMAAVWLSGLLSLLLRFDMSFAKIPANFISNMRTFLIFNIAATVIIFACNHLYSSIWAYAGVVEMQRMVIAVAEVALFEIILTTVYGLGGTAYPLPRSYHVLYFLILLVFTAGVRFLYRIIKIHFSGAGIKSTAPAKVMLIGAGETGHMVIRDILTSASVNKEVLCIIDDDKNKIGSYINGVRVVGDRNSIASSVIKYKIDEIIIAIPSADRKTVSKLAKICADTGCRLKITPSITEIVEGHVSATLLREVSVEDLLGREPVKTELSLIMGYVKDRTVLVTGGGGSIGSELCRQIAGYKPKKLIIVDIYENNAYDIEQELKMKHPELDLTVLIASVRNLKRLEAIFDKYRPELIYHAAAHKHVPLMEDSPNEAVKNNVAGTYNVVRAADKYGVKRFVLISTDKAVNPTSVMGATKRICEMIIQSFGKRSETEFVAVRFGNVLGSNGSVIPLFKKQIAEGGPVTVTDPEIIRYFMTIPEAVSLVLQAGAYAAGGEIFVLEMGEPVKILDLAKNLIRLSGFTPDKDIKIVFTGLRSGEKLYEELLMAEEGMRDTENRLIHIGKPIEMDEAKFLKNLAELTELAENEADNKIIRAKIRETVPTFKNDEA